MMNKELYKSTKSKIEKRFTYESFYSLYDRVEAIDLRLGPGASGSTASRSGSKAPLRRQG